jgi:hypothetical protein
MWLKNEEWDAIKQYISTIYSVEPSQIAPTTGEDDVKDVNDDNIGTKMNIQVLLEELNPPRARLNRN